MGEQKPIKILAIETSCDETAAAVICGANYSRRDKKQDTRNRQVQISNIQFPIVMSNVVSSQVDIHKKTGGVVPEVAARAHIEVIIPVIREALAQASNKKQDTSYKQISNLNIQNSNETMKQLSNVTHIAVTVGPGLIGSLLVGVNTAKALAYYLGLPIVPINHIEGHIYSALAEQFSIFNFQFSNKSQIQNPELEETDNGQLTTDNFQVLALTVSGGHTSLTLMKDHGVYETVGQTVDDAAGEAFDKVAKLLGLGYPGGPEISKLAEQFRNKYKKSNIKYKKFSIQFPRPMMRDGTFNFSFSGLKTAVLHVVREIENQNVIARSQRRSNLETDRHASLAMTCLSVDQKQEIAAAFEDAVVDVLVTKTLKAAEKYQPKSVILAGGVAANRRLREELTRRLKDIKIQETRYKKQTNNNFQIPNNNKTLASSEVNLLIPPLELCGDNAAMIGLAAYYHILHGDISSWDKIEVSSNLSL